MKASAEQTIDFSSRAGVSKTHPLPLRAKWAAQRLLFHSYIGFSLLTVVGGLLTAPLMTWLFFGDWRFWRHLKSGLGLFPHGFKMARHTLKGLNGGFMLDVPLTAPPSSSVNLDLVEKSSTWEFGTTCGPCARCCTKLGCPVLDVESGLCQGYDSFFWRYFNCGRYPTNQREIDFYLCNKWSIKGQPKATTGEAPHKAGELSA